MSDKKIMQEMLSIQQGMQAASVITEAQDAEGLAAMTETDHLDDRDQMNRLFGQIQMGHALSNFTNVISLSKLAEIKKTKQYRSLKGVKALDKNGNLIPNVGVWEGFCKALGFSYQKIDQDIENLEVFGAETLEQLNSLGIGYRDMRKLRKLSGEDRTAIIQGECIQVGDKEEVISLIEDMASKHAREKEELEQQLQRTNSEREADKRLLADKDQKINEQARELRRDFSPDEEKQRLQELDSQQKLKLKEKEFACIAAINEFSQVVDEVFERESLPDHVEESMYGSLRGVFRHALLVARDKGINPDQLLGLPIDASVLDQYS
ncbi:hypothetical protein [Neptuniibacter marinus]|uniref:hypothetical protein n=1 Tax=Neptuniibacter marinus TaxID=1806670 RepID=UPI000A5B0099|nr:hypothetical protein [Neptuniibacter marinus]